MKPFEELTALGQVRRLNKMAQMAIKQYDLEVRKISSLWQLFNALFRVDTLDGRKYVLRINLPNLRSLPEIRSEMTWLAALHRDSDLLVPEPLQARNGELVTTIKMQGIPQSRHCAVFSWLPGKNLAASLSVENVRKQGRFLARLHQESENFQPPEGFWLKDLRELVHGDGLDWLSHGTKTSQLISAENREIFLRTAEPVKQALSDLYQQPQDLHVMHADFHQGNIKVHKGQLSALDFDDCSWGYFVQDIAIALYYLRRQAEFSQFRQAFQQGYEEIKKWPEEYPGQIDTLMNTRAFLVIDFLIHSDNAVIKEIIPRYIAAEIPFLQAFLQKIKG
ncbi:MAG: phosphotransferase [Anaerolineaceae bacterium]|nr:phosphotransferase [Anaerolineaceae bacterium]